jgi:hypothetical protein
MMALSSSETKPRSGIAESYRNLPRAMKWLVWLVVGMALYFAVLEPAVNAMIEYRERSELALASIEKYNKADETDRSVINDGIKRWGNVLPPGPDQTRVLQAKTAIIEVLARHDLARDRSSTTERSPTKLKMTESAASNVEYWRGPIEVKFSAKPHIAMEVIGDLEMIPSIAQIASVRIRRQTDRAEVEVTLVADAWFIK